MQHYISLMYTAEMIWYLYLLDLKTYTVVCSDF